MKSSPSPGDAANLRLKPPPELQANGNSAGASAAAATTAASEHGSQSGAGGGPGGLSVAEREELLRCVRQLMAETEDYYATQERQLRTAYVDLRQRIERIRLSVGGGGGHSPISPFTMLGGAGTPVRNSHNILNGRGGAFNNANTNSNANGSPFNANATPPMKLASTQADEELMKILQDSMSKSNNTASGGKPQAQSGWNVEASNATTGAYSNGGSPFANTDTFMASPQSTARTTLDELFTRYSAYPENNFFNFDAVQDSINSRASAGGLGGKDRRSSPADAPAGAAAWPHAKAGSADGGSSGGGHADKDLIPVDTLRSMRNQHFTSGVRAVYENGRPRVETVAGAAADADSPSELGIDPAAGCRVLVEFKRRRVLQYDSDRYVAPGSHVVVGGDRGEDLGLVTFAWCEAAAGPSQQQQQQQQGVVGVGLTGSALTRSIGVGSGTVLRLASPEDVQQLHGTQAELERRAIDVCTQRVLEHNLPMTIADAEYQFDKNKLTFFYEAQQRLDFRDLVKDLFKTFRARIWMEQVQN